MSASDSHPLPDAHEGRSGILASVADAIGWTPLVALDRYTRTNGLDGRILAKLEYFSPGHSKKDRVALQIIRDARSDRRLAPGQTVLEMTSGNTGTGLAIVCGALGHPFVAVMSRGNSPERARMMRALGASVELVDQALSSAIGKVTGDDLTLAERRAQELTRELGAFRADQFNNPSNLRAHADGTGPELWRQSGGCVQAFCDFAGTAGSFAGIAGELKRQNPAIRCWVIEPEGAPALAGGPIRTPMHPLQGGGYNLPNLPLLDTRLVDGYLTVSDDAARLAAQQLATTEGVFAGWSAGANLAAATSLLRGPCRGQVVAILICDTGLKYLSTGLWD